MLIGEGATVLGGIEKEGRNIFTILIYDMAERAVTFLNPSFFNSLQVVRRAGQWPPQMGALISFPMIEVVMS